MSDESHAAGLEPDEDGESESAPADRVDYDPTGSGTDGDTAGDSRAGDPTDGRGAGPAAGPSEADAPTGGVQGTGADAPGADPGPANEPDATGAKASSDDSPGDGPQPGVPDVPDDVQRYDRFKKIEGGTYDRVNDFIRDRTYITAREWAIARLCADFRTETGVEMTKIGENLPELVPFMTDTYTPQAVNQARHAFEEKVRKAGATFLYGAMSDFFTAEELDDVMYETTEVAKFLLEVEGVDLSVEEELDAEDRISDAMREVRTASEEIRHRGTECPECGHEIGGGD